MFQSDERGRHGHNRLSWQNEKGRSTDESGTEGESGRSHNRRTYERETENGIGRAELEAKMELSWIWAEFLALVS